MFFSKNRQQNFNVVKYQCVDKLIFHLTAPTIPGHLLPCQWPIQLTTCHNQDENWKHGLDQITQEDCQIAISRESNQTRSKLKLFLSLKLICGLKIYFFFSFFFNISK